MQTLKYLMKVVVISIITMNTNAAINEDYFRKNIIDLNAIKKVSYLKLTPAERDVVDYVISNYMKRLAICDNEVYIRGEKSSQGKGIYQLKNYEHTIFIRTVALDQTDKLNDLAWRGDIIIPSPRGSAREVLNNNSFDRWYSSHDVSLSKYGSDGQGWFGTLTFYNSKLYNYTKNAHGNIFNEDQKDYLNCEQVTATIVDEKAKAQASREALLTETEKIKEQFRNKIYDNWNNGSKAGTTAKAQIHLTDSGKVSAIIVHSADPSMVTSIKEAIRAAAPYPMPSDPVLNRAVRRIIATFSSK